MNVECRCDLQLEYKLEENNTIHTEYKIVTNICRLYNPILRKQACKYFQNTVTET